MAVCRFPWSIRTGGILGTVSEGDFLWHIIDWGGYEAAKDHKIAELLRRGAPPALKITGFGR